jgi:hypothetical protein
MKKTVISIVARFSLVSEATASGRGISSGSTSRWGIVVDAGTTCPPHAERLVPRPA